MRFVSKGQERSDDYFLMKAVCEEINRHIGTRRLRASSFTYTNLLPPRICERIARKYESAGWTVAWNTREFPCGQQRTTLTLVNQ